jgi:mono/diheme cytochrome c family protein
MRTLQKAIGIGIASLLAAPLLVTGCQSDLRAPGTAMLQLGTDDTAAEVAIRDRMSALPSQRPSSIDGERIFMENCAPCHGETGRGDGPQSPGNLPDFTDFHYTRDKTPLHTYINVSSGGETYHPFGDRAHPQQYLTDQQRWDATFYVWMLHTEYDQLRRGGTSFVVNCSVCHGTLGFGDGHLKHSLMPPPRNFTIFEWMMDKSDNRLFRSIQHGRKWTAMPAWAETPGEPGGLSEQEMWEIVDYLRTFNYTYPRDIIIEQVAE